MITFAKQTALAVRRIQDEVQRHSMMFRDQPETPLDRAVYWTEYVLRYDGAPQLRSAATELAWYQRHLLDVLAVIFVTLQLLAFAAFLAVRRFVRSRLFPVQKIGAKKKIH